MGYAKTGQRGCGIHLRQFSRAFIFDDGKNMATFVSIDACMMNHGVKKAVSILDFISPEICPCSISILYKMTKKKMNNILRQQFKRVLLKF